MPGSMILSGSIGRRRCAAVQRYRVARLLVVALSGSWSPFCPGTPDVLAVNHMTPPFAADRESALLLQVQTVKAKCLEREIVRDLSLEANICHIQGVVKS